MPPQVCRQHGYDRQHCQARMGNRMANFSEFDNFDKDPLIRRAAEEDDFDDEEEFVHKLPVKKVF